jgi:hypothetical protein
VAHSREPLVRSRVTLRCNCKDAVRLDVFGVTDDGGFLRGFTGGAVRRLRSGPQLQRTLNAELKAARAVTPGPSDIGPSRYEYRCGKCGQHHEWRHNTLKTAVISAHETGRPELIAGQDL